MARSDDNDDDDRSKEMYRSEKRSSEERRRKHRHERDTDSDDERSSRRKHKHGLRRDSNRDQDEMKERRSTSRRHDDDDDDRRSKRSRRSSRHDDDDHDDRRRKRQKGGERKRDGGRRSRSKYDDYDDASESGTDDSRYEEEERRRRRKKGKRRDEGQDEAPSSKPHARHHPRNRENDGESETRNRTDGKRSRRSSRDTKNASSIVKALYEIFQEYESEVERDPSMSLSLFVQDMIATMTGRSPKNGKDSSMSKKGSKRHRALVEEFEDLVDDYYPRKSTMGRVEWMREQFQHMGITLEAVEEWESNNNSDENKPSRNDTSNDTIEQVREAAQLLLKQMFQMYNNSSETTGTGSTDSTTTPDMELKQLCERFLETKTDDDVVVSLDHMRHDNVRSLLEALLVGCGLEKVEMEIEDSPVDDDGDDTLIWGYARPFDNPKLDSQVQDALQAVMDLTELWSKKADRVEISGEAKQAASGAKPGPAARRPVQGPAWKPGSVAAGGESDSDEGPLLPGSAAAAAAAHAARQRVGIAAAKAANKSGREEWMLHVPTESSHVSMNLFSDNNAPRSRGFSKARASESKKASSDRPVDAAVRNEIESLRQAHQSSRGPSLMEEHQAKQKAAAESKAAAWQWNRDRDLDSGRRVDRNALQNVLGGGAQNLRNKFHTSY